MNTPTPSLFEMYQKGWIPPKATIVVALTTLGFTDEAAEELVLKVAGTEVQANKSAKWSAEDTDLLLSLHAEGVRIPDIALRLKRTRASVHQRLQYIKNAQTH